MHLEVAVGPPSDQRAAVLGQAGPVDRVDDLERVLHDEPAGTCRKAPPRPEGGVGGLELVAVDRQALGVPCADQLAVLARTPPRASTGSRPARPAPGRAPRSTIAPGALHDPPRARAARASVRVTTSGTPLVAARSCSARRGRGSAGSSSRTRAPPDRAARRTRRPQRGLAQLRERAPVARARARQRVVERRLAVAPGLICDRRGAVAAPSAPRRRVAGSDIAVTGADPPAPTSWRIWS